MFVFEKFCLMVACTLSAMPVMHYFLIHLAVLYFLILLLRRVFVIAPILYFLPFARLPLHRCRGLQRHTFLWTLRFCSPGLSSFFRSWLRALTLRWPIRAPLRWGHYPLHYHHQQDQWQYLGASHVPVPQVMVMQLAALLPPCSSSTSFASWTPVPFPQCR